MLTLILALILAFSWPRGALMGLVTAASSPGGWLLLRSTPYKDGEIRIYMTNPHPLESDSGELITFERPIVFGLNRITVLGQAYPSQGAYIEASEPGKVECIFPACGGRQLLKESVSIK